MSGTILAERARTDLLGPESTEFRLLQGRVLRGCNVHHRSTVFVQRVDLGEFGELRTDAAGPEFAARFVDRFGSLRTVIPDGCLSPEFLAELNGATGVPLDRALLEAIRAVELAMAFKMRRLDTRFFTKLVRDPRSPRVAELVWQCHSGSVSRAAARIALAGLLELMPISLTRSGGETSGAFTELLQKRLRKARRRQWSPTTAALALAANERGVPFETLAGAHLRLGEGVMQHVVSASSPGLARGPAVPWTTGDEVRDAGRAALESIVPSGVSASVSTAVIVGDRGAAALARDLDGLLRASGSAVGLATRKLTTISGKPVDPTSLGRSSGARFLLADPRVEALVYAVSPRRVVARGLRLDRSTATAILDPTNGSDSDDNLRGIDVCVAATSGTVVVGADHPLAERLVAELEPRRLVLLSPLEPTPVVIRHLASGGCAVVRGRNGSAEFFELRRSGDTVASIPVALLRSKKVRIGERRLRRAMFSTALAFGLGLTGPEIVAAIEKRRYFRR